MEADRRKIAAALEAYEVGEEIGRGAWGVVYSGHHRRLDRDVAIKLLPTAFGADPSLRARFVSEARLVASLDHPHIVPVYDYVERDGLYLIVMEYLPGGTLWERFSSRGVALDAGVAFILASCAALGYAHERDILHRDVKPDNLLITARGTPKLTDFGIAKLLSSTRTALTVAGTAMGTPAYMAPEQAQGGAVSPATDVYACAVMLYELLAGTLPFPESPDPMAQLYQHVHQPPRPLGEVAPAVPGSLRDVIMRALAKSPPDRYRSAEDLGVALATAATAAWGRGWLARTGITIMDQGRISAVTQHQMPAVRAPAAPPTILVRGTGLDHPVLEPLTEGAEPVEEVTGLAAPAPLTAPPPPSPPMPSPSGPPSRRPVGPSEPAVLAPLPPGHVGSVRPRTKRSSAGLVATIALVVLVALGVGLGALLVLRDDKDDDERSSRGTPEQAVEALFQALQQQDCQAVVDAMTEESWAFVMAGAEPGGPSGPVTRDEAIATCSNQDEEQLGMTGTLDQVEILSQTDTTATVQVTVTEEAGREPSVEELVLVRQGDTWKLDVPAMSSGAGSEQPAA